MDSAEAEGRGRPVRRLSENDVMIDDHLPPVQRVAMAIPVRDGGRKKDRYREIGHQLRCVFNDVVNEPIPADLITLLKKLEERSGPRPETDS
jgi:hypothetical protein